MLVPVVATNGAQVLGSYAVLIGVDYLCFFLHAILIYATTVFLLGRINPLRFFKEMTPAMLFAYSSDSSVATLPYTMECTRRLGVKKDLGNFVLSLGATVNMDGTSIMQGVAVVFIAQAYGIDLTLGNLATVVVTATLASIGTAGVPSVGLVTLSMVLTSVGLPVEGIALIMGIDRILDMMRTAVNITGDAVCTTIIADQEKVLNREVFNRE